MNTDPNSLLCQTWMRLVQTSQFHALKNKSMYLVEWPLMKIATIVEAAALLFIVLTQSKCTRLLTTSGPSWHHSSMLVNLSVFVISMRNLSLFLVANALWMILLVGMEMNHLNSSIKLKFMKLKRMLGKLSTILPITTNLECCTQALRKFHRVRSWYLVVLCQLNRTRRTITAVIAMTRTIVIRKKMITRTILMMPIII